MSPRPSFLFFPCHVFVAHKTLNSEPLRVRNTIFLSFLITGHFICKNTLLRNPSAQEQGSPKPTSKSEKTDARSTSEPYLGQLMGSNSTSVQPCWSLTEFGAQKPCKRRKSLCKQAPPMHVECFPVLMVFLVGSKVPSKPIRCLGYESRQDTWCASCQRQSGHKQTSADSLK